MSREPVNACAETRLPRWVGPIVFVLLAAVVALLGVLAMSIMERRWEAQRPQLAVVAVDEWETDSAVWGRNYPREYETSLQSRDDTTRTKFGGAFPRDYLDDYPAMVVLWAGYGFSKDYRQGRGHAYTVEDVTATKRVGPATPATCWTCKSPDVPRLMSTMGVTEFYAAGFMDLKSEITHPVGCLDCHDPETMRLRISRPALREAFKAMGSNVDDATHQQMRSLVCAQCHVEYYFKDKTYLTFPWAKGTTVEGMLEYYNAAGFSDWTHAVSKTPMLKAQHPDWELYRTGIHAYRSVACADCHMPYISEGGVKFTDHHVQSPLLAVSRSCAVCHRWSEDEVRLRVTAIQQKVEDARKQAEDVLAKAHFDIAAAMQAGAADEALEPVRQLVRRAQFRWDYVAANNGMGFHSPQESMRILGDASREAQEARLSAARIMAAKGISAAPAYPDISTRDKAAAVTAAFVDGQPPALLPSGGPTP